ncbi:MAG: hypothetical protein KC731_26705, partial [Myxococcales bacterium]|nr:hypothetical protein [Myxococcales bacterium]
MSTREASRPADDAGPDTPSRDDAPVSRPSKPRRYKVDFDQAFIDPDVRKVVRRLARHGHEAYLVGG